MIVFEVSNLLLYQFPKRFDILIYSKKFNVYKKNFFHAPHA